MPFGFEKLDVYRLATRFAKDAREVTKGLAKSDWKLADQLRRAAVSIPLNIAEGSGRYHVGEKKRFYHIARGSCHECAAALKLCSDSELVDPKTLEAMIHNLDRISRMLTGLIQSVDRQK